MISERPRQANGHTFTRHATFNLNTSFSLQPNMPATLKEARINLALEALQNDKNLSIKTAAKIYNIARITLRYQRISQSARYNILANSRKLIDLEERAIL